MKTKYENADYDTDQHEDNNGLLIGIMVGAALGALAAILFAPKSGKDTRDQIKDLAEKQKENLKQQWDITKEKAKDVVDTAKGKTRVGKSTCGRKGG